MAQIVLIRPGMSEFDEQGRIQGTLDIPLSTRGEQQVCRGVEQLRSLGLTAVYSSPCQAAWQTAQVLAAGLSIKAKQLDGLDNLDHGLWQGMQVDEVKRKQPKVFRQWQENPENVCPPEGEMVCDCRKRAEQTLAKLVRKHRTSLVGVVVPEPLATILCELLTTETAVEQWEANPTGCQWGVINTESRVLELLGSVLPGEDALPVVGGDGSLAIGTTTAKAATNGRLGTPSQPLSGRGDQNGHPQPANCDPAQREISLQNGLNSGSISAGLSLKSN
jgi:probable phosphoglycerate mutase